MVNNVMILSFYPCCGSRVRTCRMTFQRFLDFARTVRVGKIYPKLVNEAFGVDKSNKIT